MSGLFVLGRFVAEEGVPHTDDKGITTHHWLLPETAEIIYGGLASLIIFAVVDQVCWADGQKGPRRSHGSDPKAAR